MNCALIAFISMAFLPLFNASATQLPGRWQSRAPTPTPRSEVAAVQLNGKIYLMGGYVQHGDLLEEYDPAKNSWRRRAPLPKPLHHLGGAAANGKIYLIGGYITGVGSVRTVYEYDPAADRWSVKQPMPTARGALAIGIIAGKIYAIGGVGSSDRWRDGIPRWR
jgi:N-acetylneuraminic acid mutarotase